MTTEFIQLLILVLALSGIVLWVYIFGLVCGVFPPPRWERREETRDKPWQMGEDLDEVLKKIA